MKYPAKVVVAGGGIGGLTAAIALRRAGFEVSVFERAAELREVGAGLLLAANAQKALAKLGLANAVARLGTPASAGEIRSWRGHVLASIPASELENKMGIPSAAVHRADLQALLAREVKDGTLRLGTEVEAFEQDESGVRILLADGGHESADVLVGADGLRSRIRGGLFGSGEPRYAGYTAWRAVMEPKAGLLPWGTGFEAWGRGARFGCAHIGDGRVYWFATRNAPEGEKDGPPGSPAGAKAKLLRLFEGWHRLVGDLVEATEQAAILRTDIYDRQPLGEGKGDAAGRRGPPHDAQPGPGSLPGHRGCGGVGTLPRREGCHSRVPAELRKITFRPGCHDSSTLAPSWDGRPGEEPGDMLAARSGVTDDPAAGTTRATGGGRRIRGVGRCVQVLFFSCSPIGSRGIRDA